MFLYPLYGYCTGGYNIAFHERCTKDFSSLASYVFQLVKSAASHDRTRTDLIMDQYPDVSIKNPEKEQRGAGGSIKIATNHGNQKCPTQWKKYLSDGSNKANLASFLVHEWQKPEYFVRLWFTVCHSRDGVS